MKKLLALFLVMALMVGTFAACNNTPETSSTPSSSEESVVDEPIEDPIESEEEPSEEPYDEPYEEPWEEDPIEESNLSPEEARKESILLGEDEQLNKEALYNEGNLSRLAKVIKKSQKGELVTIVFYGNSANTSLNHDEAPVDNPYTDLFATWWNQNIGPCVVKRAGMDNLTSYLACMRVEQDVLRFEPDLVFLDFAVQDGLPQAEGANYTIAYDNLIRRLLQSKTKPALVSLVLTGAEQQGYTMNVKNADMFASNSAKEKDLAKYYSLPTIDFETALWETMISLVKVTPQTEYPVMSWADVSLTNVIMNNEGHRVLFGTIEYFFAKVLGKLSSISTADFKYPTKGKNDSDMYMKGEFINMEQLYDIGVPGYSFDVDRNKMGTYGYAYRPAVDNDSRYPLITTHRPTDYFEITIPEVKRGERCYFMMQTPWQSTDGYADAEHVHMSPYRIYCYNSAGKETADGGVKPVSGPYKQCYHSGRTNAVQIPVGTTKLIIKCYTKGGYIRWLGMSYFDKQ